MFRLEITIYDLEMSGKITIPQEWESWMMMMNPELKSDQKLKNAKLRMLATAFIAAVRFYTALM